MKTLMSRKLFYALVTVTCVGGFCAGTVLAQEMVYPQNADWWTGTCYEYGRQQNGEIEWRDPDINRHSGWAKFDLSSIPDTITVTGVRFHYRVEMGTGSPAVSIRKIWLDPVRDDGAGTYSAIETGQEFGMGMGAPGWQSVSLNADGVRHIQSCLEQDWVALGFWSKSLSTNWARAFGHSSSDRPYLVVNYTVAGVAEPGQVRLPLNLGIRPTVVSNGWAELFYAGAPELPGRVLVYDAIGRVVIVGDVSGQEPGAVVALDLRGLESGVYFARLETDERAATTKFLVQ